MIVCPHETCRLTMTHSHGTDRFYLPRKQVDTDGCPRDTNGDGDCGQVACPECGQVPPRLGTFERALYDAFCAGARARGQWGIPKDLGSEKVLHYFREWRRSLLS